MTLTLDLQQLRDHFVDHWDDGAIQTVFANATSADLDKEKLFVRFTIIPGANRLIGGGDLRSQLGRVVLQIFVPPGRGTTDGYEVADLFTALFRGWISDDGRVRCEGEDITSIQNSDDVFQINVSVRWESIRRA